MLFYFKFYLIYLQHFITLSNQQKTLVNWIKCAGFDLVLKAWKKGASPEGGIKIFSKKASI